MKHLPQLNVAPFTYDDQAVVEAGGVTTYSKLFRTDTRLGEVLGVALERTGPKELFRVVSAGCSFGAEIDSILGTVEYNDARRVAILGVDVNPDALTAAKSGQYQIFVNPKLEYRKAGLDFDEVMDHIQFDFNDERFALDTNKLRQKHSVTVREADLSQGLPTKHLANVVMCNNVLFHLEPAAADGIVDNLTAHVAPGGILSFGDNRAQTGMEANEGMSYGDWLRQVGARLGEQGMKPALYSGHLPDTAIAFMRTDSAG